MKKAFLIIGALSASFALSAQDASASADSLFNMLDEITVVSEVIDVAVAAGFVSHAHFSKCYRQLFDVTPTEERRRAF